MIRLYLVEQDYNTGYDTYDSVVVAAKSVKDAIRMDPSGLREWSDELGSWMFVSASGLKTQEDHTAWAPISQLTCRCIGRAKEGTKPGIILASFNAG